MIRFPHHLERQYAARLLRRLRAARTLLLERIRHPGRFDQQDIVPPAPPPEGPPPAATVSAVKRAFQVALPLEFESLMPTAKAVDTWATRSTVREIQQLVKVDLEGDTRIAGDRAEQRALHWKWARDNVSLIRSMESDTFDDLADHVTEAVVEGRTDLAQVIRDRFGVAESRAKLIARDQIAKLNGKITEERQTALGVQAYEWSSSGDERVRPTHRHLDGTIRLWSNPHPTEGHPGSAIACRCVAIPVIDESLVPAEVPTRTRGASTAAPTG